MLFAMELHVPMSSSDSVEDTPISEFKMPSTTFVELTPLSYFPGAMIERFLGHISMHLIKERSLAIINKKDNFIDNGLGLFTHELITEATAVMRSHIAALGGNAMVGYRIDEIRLNENTESAKSGYCLLSISGDALYVRSSIPNLGFRKVTKLSSTITPKKK